MLRSRQIKVHHRLLKVDVHSLLDLLLRTIELLNEIPVLISFDPAFRLSSLQHPLQIILKVAFAT